MIPKVKIDDLFFKRRQREMGDFLEQLEIYEEEAHGEQDEKKRLAAEDKMAAFFPSSASERQTWNIVLKEGDFNRAISDWQSSGSAVFAFRDDLLQMFLQSDIHDMPIHAIHFPYDSLYLYFGDTDLFPGLSDQYQVDGVLISTDSLYRQLGHGKAESAEALMSRQIDFRNMIQSNFDHWRKQKGAEAEEKAAYWRSRLDGMADLHSLVQKDLEKIQLHQEMYQMLQTDPDNCDYESFEHYWCFLHMTVEATLIRRDKGVKRLTPQEIIDRPAFTAIYTFNKHSTTIAQAIQEGIKECSGYAADCAFEGLNWESEGRMEDMYGKPIDLENGEWRVDTREDSEGQAHNEYIRLNNVLNVCSQPDFIDTITKVVFNALCYLNWRERDVEESYSDPKFQTEISSAPRKKQEKLRKKAGHLGYRKLWFCGYNSPRVDRSQAGGSVKTHWRRGHWRNQLFGKGLSHTRLTWIRPVIVKKSEETPTNPTIYR